MMNLLRVSPSYEGGENDCRVTLDTQLPIQSTGWKRDLSPFLIALHSLHYLPEMLYNNGGGGRERDGEKGGRGKGEEQDGTEKDG